MSVIVTTPAVEVFNDDPIGNLKSPVSEITVTLSTDGYDDESSSKGEHIVKAGPGPLGLRLANDKGKVGFVGTLLESSPLFGKLHKGDRIIKLNGQDVREMNARELSDLISQSKDKERVFTVVKKELDLKSEAKVQALYTSGLKSTKERNFSTAKKLFIKILKADQNAGFDMFNSLGNVHYKEGYFDAAIENYNEAARHIQKHDSQAGVKKRGLMCNKGAAYLRKNEVGEALKLFQGVMKEIVETSFLDIDRDLRIANINTKIGGAHLKKKNFGSAKKHYLVAYKTLSNELGPNHPESDLVKHSIGIILAKEGKMDDALQVFRGLLQRKMDIEVYKVDTAKLLLDISEVYLALGDEKFLTKIDKYCEFADETFKDVNIAKNHEYLRQMRRIISKRNVKFKTNSPQ